MRRLVPVVAFCAAAAAAGPSIAQSSDIFMCVDDQGNKSFQNVGSGKGCKRVDAGPVLSLPASRTPANRTTQPAEERVSVSPASYPRVDRDTQRSRDSDRRRILEDELKVEEERLGRLRAEFNNGEPERRGDERNYALYQDRVQRLRDDIARVENNVGALRREIALLRTQ